MKIVFAKRAENDLEQLLKRTAEQWGFQQRDRLTDSLDNALEQLLAHPEIGQPREEISRGLRSLFVSHHHIYYRIRGDQLRVMRVLNERRQYRR